MKLKDKVAIITGAAAGIGKAAALRFAREGARLALADIDREGLGRVVEEIESAGVPVLGIQADVGEVQDTERIVAETLSRFGTIEVLVNNAATTRLTKPVVEMTVQEWDSCLNATLRSVFLLSKLAAPEMRNAGGGTILNVGSVGATMAWAGGAAYCAAKSGILALTKVLATEFGPWNIRVITLSPGAIMTPNLEEAVRVREGHLDRLKAKSVLGRVGQPEEIAAVM
ncbi:MAG: SDR family NAD(P)-dependent oxidoreductase, partial [Bryobacteraceae bacterium]